MRHNVAFLEVQTSFLGRKLPEKIDFDQKLKITGIDEASTRKDRIAELDGNGRFGALYQILLIARNSGNPITLKTIDLYRGTVGIEQYKVIQNTGVHKVLVLTLKNSFLRSLNPFLNKIERKIDIEVLS